ncbi:uncharacterized protein MKZ38_001952 [Zalerion maritima]|uniref:Uncharacterized protein n=1 Tax=Zalerion maritima TaxID=339359 RepID=A0AAD5RPI8_9PEZI|nr:uncharacterized protein MKZ38_001952 [Zalerion maritima]
MLYNMSYPSAPASGLAPPPAKHWGYKPNTLTTSFPIRPAPSVAPPRPKHLPQGMPFDPAELSRRLAVVERKQQAKDRARAAQAALGSKHVPRPIDSPLRMRHNVQTSPEPYRHVPSNATAQLASTTNDSIRSAEYAHELLQLSGRPLVPDEKVSTIERRAQIHTSTIPENVTASVAIFDNHAKPRSRPHTIDGNALMTALESRAMGNGHARHHSASAAAGSSVANKRSSKGSFEADGKTRHSWLLLSPPPIESDTPEPERDGELRALDQDTINEHRVDWTQRDEESKTQGSSKKSLKMKKADSIWTLKGRLSGLGRHQDKDKDGRVTSPKKTKLSGEFTAASPSVKSPRSGFFARFRRQ